MNKYPIPMIFRQLQAEGCLRETDILNTRDGFYLAYKSLSDMLAEKSILDFLDSEGRRLACGRFFDDWFLYAVPGEEDYTYGLLKMREQEHDQEEDLPADGDTPGVTISFISFEYRTLLECLQDPSDENRQNLNREINRVVARRGQRHDDVLKRYFANPASEGAYLAASLYPKHIAAFVENGCLAVPDHYREIVRKYARCKNDPKVARLPVYLESLNREAGRVVCDHEKIYVQDPAAPDRFECAAILATHTANTSVYSFAAEVEYHARFLIPILRVRIPFAGSVYESAIRADMTIGDTECQGLEPFYRAESRIVKRQYALHREKLPEVQIGSAFACEGGREKHV